MSQTTEELTLGEKRVRTKFNPGSNDSVQKIKDASASIIDDLECMKNDEFSKTYESGASTLENVSGEKLRLIAIAQTKFEEAAMWAVKAATA